MAEKINKSAFTLEEVQEAGFFGEKTDVYPNELHLTGSEQLRYDTFQVQAVPEPMAVESTATEAGAVVNGPAKNSPAPTGGTSGPGAKTDTSKDDK